MAQHQQPKQTDSLRIAQLLRVTQNSSASVNLTNDRYPKITDFNSYLVNHKLNLKKNCQSSTIYATVSNCQNANKDLCSNLVQSAHVEKINSPVEESFDNEENDESDKPQMKDNRNHQIEKKVNQKMSEFIETSEHFPNIQISEIDKSTITNSPSNVESNQDDSDDFKANIKKIFATPEDFGGAKFSNPDLLCKREYSKSFDIRADSINDQAPIDFDFFPQL